MNRRQQISRAAPLGVLLALTLAACTVVSHRPAPAGWPELNVTIHRVSSKEMHDACASLAPAFGLLSYVEACAWVRLCKKTCDVYLDRDYPNESILEHELMHCKGHDHIGGTVFEDATRKWLADPVSYCKEEG